MSQSLEDTGNDEEREEEYCSYCAHKDGKLQPALHFCFDCGVYGKYVCVDCLWNHNRFVKDHDTVKIINPSTSRR